MNPLTHLVKVITDMAIFFFAFIHWVVIEQALSESPRQKVEFQGSVVAGMTGTQIPKVK